MPDFPNGLVQPAGAARFSLDALLLAGYVRSLWTQRLRHKAAGPCIELGSGCGAVCIALGLEKIAAIGVEKEGKLYESACCNLQKYSLTRYVSFSLLDIERREELNLFKQGIHGCFLVCANPPWHHEKTVLSSPSRLHNSAHLTSSLSFFCPQAAVLLPHHGYYSAIIPANIFCAYAAASRKSHMGLREILPVASHTGEEMKRLLILTQKNAADDLRMLPPLIVHQPDGSWTRELRQFCPWLANHPSAR